MDYGLGAAIGGGLNIFGTWLNNEYAKEREKIAREENYKYNELSAVAADKRTRALFSDLYSPQAQLQQLKNAGLSPSLYYSGGVAGSSGQSGAQGNGASGIAPNIYGVNLLEGAQLDKLQAETRLTNAQADNELGKSEKGKALIDEIKSRVQLNNLEKQLKDIEVTINTANSENAIRKFEYETEQAMHNANLIMYNAINSKINAELNNATYMDKVEQAAKQTQIMDIQKLLLNSQIGLNEAQAARAAAEIKKWNEELAIGYWRTCIEDQKSESYRDFVENTQTYQKNQIENFKDKLKQDREIWDEKKSAMWTNLIWGNANQTVGNVVRAVVKK